MLATSVSTTVPGQGGCTVITGGAFSCAFQVGAPAGDDTFDVEAYDAPNAAGHALSEISGYPFDVIPGHANQIAMTLGGIPESLNVTLRVASIFATGSASAGFQFGGVGRLAAEQVQVTAEDADGNAIVGPGAPRVGLTGSDARLSVAPVAGVAGTFLLTPLGETNAVPDAGTAIVLTAEATPAIGPALAAKVGVQLEPILYVQNYQTNVLVYAPWNAAPILTIPNDPRSNRRR